MSECSIVIPTYQRPGYLKRILGYYNDSHVPYNIIIADGSSDEIKQLNNDTVSSFQGLKIQHLKYPIEMRPDVRVAEALNHVNTSYSVFCADDDFVTINGIRQSVDFLERNLGFTAAHGRYFGFHLEEDKQGKQQFYLTPTWQSEESITSSDPIVRFSQHLSAYSQTTFYAVHRTELLKMIYAELPKSKFDYHFSEFLLSMLTIIYGKLKFLDVFYAARDVDSPMTGGTRPTFRSKMDKGEYEEEYSEFRERLSIHLSKQSELNMEESRKVVDEAMTAYLKKYHIYRNKIGELTFQSGIFLSRLNLPDWIDGGIRRSYKRLYGLRRGKVNKTPVYIDIPVSSPYYDEFKKIRQHVLSSV